MQPFFSFDIDLTLFDQPLSRARSVQSALVIDSARKLITCEYTQHNNNQIDRYFLNVYDMERNGTKILTLPVNKGIRVFSTMALVRDPDQVLLIIKENGIQSAQVISISQKERIGNPIEIPRVFAGLKGAVASAFSNNDYRWPFSIDVFDNGGSAILHDGQSDVMGHRLVNIDLVAGRIRGKTVDTMGPEDLPVGGGIENRASVIAPSSGYYFVGTRAGEIQKRSLRDLALVSSWSVRLPEFVGPDDWYGRQIYAMAATSYPQLLAIGTTVGSIHLFDFHTERETVKPIVSHDYHYPVGNKPSEQSPPAVARLTFANNGRYLVSIHGRGDLRLWETGSGRQIGPTHRLPTPHLYPEDPVVIDQDLRLFWYSKSLLGGGESSPPFGTIDLRNYLENGAPKLPN